VAREHAGLQGGIGRSPPPVGFSGPRCRGARAFRFRRRDRGDRAKNDPASSACVCREGDRSPKEAKTLWAAIKAEEKSAINAALRETGGADGEDVETSPGGLLDDVPLALPGLTRAVKLQTKASGVGFDWNEARLVLAKIREETDEIEAVLDTREPAAIAEEIGDLLFNVANLVRHVETDPEAALRRANAKFERRFRFVEDALAAKGMAPGAAALAEMETLKNTAKQSEKQVTP
jgi:nucleoside triphosphate diphosphatase